MCSYWEWNHIHNSKVSSIENITQQQPSLNPNILGSFLNKLIRVSHLYSFPPFYSIRIHNLRKSISQIKSDFKIIFVLWKSGIICQLSDYKSHKKENVGSLKIITYQELFVSYQSIKVIRKKMLVPWKLSHIRNYLSTKT